MLFILASADLEQQINSLSIRTVAVASIIIGLVSVVAVALSHRKKLFKKFKPLLFGLLASTLIISTCLLFGSTIYLNNNSESGGPVHWHTDIEFWACGSELELRNPTGKLSNKIGTSTYHEHNDKRMHLEGVVVQKSVDASLEKFMRVSGGYITRSSVAVPLNDEENLWLAGDGSIDGDTQLTDLNLLSKFIRPADLGTIAEFKNDQKCGDLAAEVQVFVYTFNKADDSYSQARLDNPASYVMRDEPIVPPGDCVIVEFDAPKSRTDRLCRQYGVRDTSRCTEFGVEQYSDKLCNIREVN